MSRRFQMRRSPIHGRGVFAVTDIPADERLVEYTGRLLTHAQADRAYGELPDDGHTFLFTLNDRYVIDANVGGNTARWINHSCDPNCQAVLEEDEDGDPCADQVFIETLRPVRAGEELTYDYGIVLDEPHTAEKKRTWTCHCGARACTGTMLKPKRKRKRKPKRR